MVLASALLALHALSARRAPKLRTDSKTPHSRFRGLRKAGVDIAEDAIRELSPFRYTVRIKNPKALGRSIRWAAKNLRNADGVKGQFAYNGTSRADGDADYGIKELGNGKICVQLGEGRDSGFKDAILKQLQAWKDHPPRPKSTAQAHERALRELMLETKRICFWLEKDFGFEEDYVHFYVHTKKSSTALHGDGNLTFDDEDMAAARAVLTSQPRPIEFVMCNAENRSVEWKASDPQRNLGVAYGGLLATASILGGVEFLGAGVCDLSADVGDAAAHRRASPVWIKHVVNRAGAFRKNDKREGGVSLVISGILLNRA